MWLDCKLESHSWQILKNMHAQHSSALENFAQTGICVSEGAIRCTEIYILRQRIMNTNMMKYTLSTESYCHFYGLHLSLCAP